MIGKIKKIIESRVIIKYLVDSQLKSSYRDKLLGNLWSLLDPLMLMLVYSIVFGFIFKNRAPNYRLFLFPSILAWRLFKDATSSAATSIFGSANLIKKAPLPKAIFPITSIIIAFHDYIWGLLALAILMFFYKVSIGISILWLPVIIFVELVFTAGMAFLLACIGVYFRDINNLTNALFRMWWYLSPGLYAVSRIPEKYRTVYMLNPMAPIFVSYRNAFIDNLPPDPMLGVAFVISLFFFFLGTYIFLKHEADFAKNV